MIIHFLVLQNDDKFTTKTFGVANGEIGGGVFRGRILYEMPLKLSIFAVKNEYSYNFMYKRKKTKIIFVIVISSRFIALFKNDA